MRTKTEALSAFRAYMHDARKEGRREGYRVDPAQTWAMMVETWRDDGEIDAETAKAWAERGPR